MKNRIFIKSIVLEFITYLVITFLLIFTFELCQIKIVLAQNSDNSLIRASTVERSLVTNTREIHVGNLPDAIAINPITNMIYVANGNSSNISVIDGKNNIKIKDIRVGKNPSSIAINNVTNIIYITNSMDNTVSVIDGKTNNLTNTIRVGNWPDVLAVNPFTNIVYVANGNSHSMSIINGTSNKVIKTIQGDVGDGFPSITINIRKNLVYVPSLFPGNNHFIFPGYISVINGQTNKIIKNISMGMPIQFLTINSKTNKMYSFPGPNRLSVIDATTFKTLKTVLYGNASSSSDIAINPNTNLLYVVNKQSNTISVINGTTNTVLDDIQLDSNPYKIAINPNTNLLYVVNKQSNTISVINGTTNTVSIGSNPSSKINGIRVSMSTNFFDINPNSNRIYTTASESKDISIIDSSNDSLIKIVEVGKINFGSVHRDLSINPNTNKIYISNSDYNNVSVVDGKTNTWLYDIKVGNSPNGIAVDKESNKIYVANRQSKTLSVIDGETDKVIDTITGVSDPFNVAVDPDNNFIYVTNLATNILSKIDSNTNKIIRNIPIYSPLYVAVDPFVN